MKENEMSYVNKTMIVIALGAMVSVSACTTDSAIDNTVGATGFVVKTAAKGAVGAGKLAVKGAKRVAGSD
jgi:hypothetical protein